MIASLLRSGGAARPSSSPSPSPSPSGLNAAPPTPAIVDRAIVPLLLVAGLLYFTGLGAFPLSNPDEGLYGELPREMLESGNYITPQCNYARYPDKPPLMTWLGAGLYRVAGCSDFTARFWTAAFGVAGVFAVWLLGRSLWGPVTGILGALIYATSAGTVVFSRFMLLDQAISTLLAFTLLGLWRMVVEEGSGRRGWAIAAGVFAGAAVLTKGLQGAVLPAGIFLLAMLLDPRFRARVRLSSLVWASGAFLAVALPWHLIAAWKDPESLRILLFNEQVERFFDRREPHDYETLPVAPFIAIFLAWGLPWSLGLGVLFPRKGRDARTPSPVTVPEGAPRPHRFVTAWLLLVLAFFTASQCRLPPYSLPALGALSLFLADGWRKALEYRGPGRDWGALSAQLLLGVFAVAFLGLLDLFRQPASELLGGAGRVRWGFALGWMILAGVGVGPWMGFRGRAAGAFFSMATAAALLSVGAAFGLGAYQEQQSFRSVVRELERDQAPEDCVVVLDHPREYESIGGLCFYLKRRILVLKHPGRPVSPYPHRLSEQFWIGESAFRDLWQSKRPIYLISERGDVAFPASLDPRDSREVSVHGGKRIQANFGACTTADKAPRTRSEAPGSF